MYRENRITRHAFLSFAPVQKAGKKVWMPWAAFSFNPLTAVIGTIGRGTTTRAKGSRLPHPKFNPQQWSQVEMLVDAGTGTARMAVAQPVGDKAVEVLRFGVAEAGKVGPIGWQMHNKGLFDEYKDVRIEVNPTTNQLITAR